MKNYLIKNHLLKVLFNKIKNLVCKINKLIMKGKYFSVWIIKKLKLFKTVKIFKKNKILKKIKIILKIKNYHIT
jgi:hypothetical protein